MSKLPIFHGMQAINDLRCSFVISAVPRHLNLLLLIACKFIVSSARALRVTHSRISAPAQAPATAASQLQHIWPDSEQRCVTRFGGNKTNADLQIYDEGRMFILFFLFVIVVVSPFLVRQQHGQWTNAVGKVEVIRRLRANLLIGFAAGTHI